jgi:3-hydroxy-9,10-secoandrosta-1,3,5(10)-triene-9,17-dione monooxygenase reductase component
MPPGSGEGGPGHAEDLQAVRMMAPATTAADREPDLDVRHFRSVLGLFATGVVAVTGIDPASGRPAGLTANSFTSVSLHPPLVSVCLARTSGTWRCLRAAGSYCVNILAEHQLDICLQLATPATDKFRGLAWAASPGGHPILDGVLGWIDCRAETEHAAGDHIIVVGRVRGLGLLLDGRPLVFYRGRYHRCRDLDHGAPPGAASAANAHRSALIPGR